MTLLLEMAGYRSYTEWLARPMTREETAKLTKAEMHDRRLAQTRACRARQRVAAAMAKVAHHDAKLAAGRDIIRLEPVILT